MSGTWHIIFCAIWITFAAVSWTWGVPGLASALTIAAVLRVGLAVIDTLGLLDD